MAENLKNMVYLVGLTRDEGRRARDDFASIPLPGWGLAELLSEGEIPLPALAGRAVLVVGCGGTVNHSEALWLARLFACGCPWVAARADPSWPSAQALAAAGAAAAVERPLQPHLLREVLRRDALPRLAGPEPPPLSVGRLLVLLAAVQADILLKLTSPAGRTGFLALRAGNPIHASVLNGPSGAGALDQILEWRSGRVLGQRLPLELGPNLPADPPAWLALFDAPEPQRPAAREVPGAAEALAAVRADLSGVRACALADLDAGVLLASATDGAAAPADLADLEAVAALLAESFDAGGAAETPEQVALVGPDAWCLGARFGPEGLALVLAGDGFPPLGHARDIVERLAAELAVVIVAPPAAPLVVLDAARPAPVAPRRVAT